MDAKNSNQMDELAEKIALEDFDELHTPHQFSETYTQKKKKFMEEIVMKEKAKKKKRLLITAASLLIGIPTTVYGANEIYDIVVQKQNYEVKVSLDNQSHEKNNRLYKLQLGYLPKGMKEDEKGSMEYSFNKSDLGGFTFTLYRIGKHSDFNTKFAKNYQEKEINGHKAVIVKTDSGDDREVDNRETLLFFEKEGIMLHAYVGEDVSEKQLLKVLKNAALKPATKATASDITDYDQMLEDDEKYGKPDTKVTPLQKDSKQIVSVGQTFLDEEFMDSQLSYTIDNVKVNDSIQPFNKDNFNDVGMGNLRDKGALSKDNKFVPYKRNLYKLGDGTNSLNKLIKSDKIDMKFVTFTATIKNVSAQKADEIYMNPSLVSLKSTGDSWNFTKPEMMDETTAMTGEVDYLEPHGKGNNYYNIGELAPSESKKVNIGFFVDRDKLNSMFLKVQTSGFENKDMNAKDRHWVDLRQK
ncbi:hypothetical protein A374_15708 [Fictibacillus macauensis ZFHKF-1]|uniref:DUF4367 domain-containing protein n=1 Tax=Fictibacillus macauensis ZFHKF-1 TaxID=1196324 RepID=I8IXN0_9BACL|nr:hypothetical protein [Fictibacillus macauensis]EIT84246.1 hypothetical protein A374_15708 [Fictibacillus macauensis ZFHKF-1]